MHPWVRSRSVLGKREVGLEFSLIYLVQLGMGRRSRKRGGAVQHPKGNFGSTVPRGVDIVLVGGRVGDDSEGGSSPGVTGPVGSKGTIALDVAYTKLSGREKGTI